MFINLFKKEYLKIFKINKITMKQFKILNIFYKINEKIKIFIF